MLEAELESLEYQYGEFQGNPTLVPEVEPKNLEHQCGGFQEHLTRPNPRRENLAYEYNEFLETLTPVPKARKKSRVYEYDGFQETSYSISHFESNVAVVVYLYATLLQFKLPLLLKYEFPYY